MSTTTETEPMRRKLFSAMMIYKTGEVWFSLEIGWRDRPVNCEPHEYTGPTWGTKEEAIRAAEERFGPIDWHPCAMPKDGE